MDISVFVKAVNWTPRENSLFSLIPELVRYTEGHKKRDFIKTDKIPAFVNPSGQISNYILEDLEAISNVIRSGVLD